MADRSLNRWRAAAVLSPLAGVAGYLLLGRPLIGALLSLVVVVVCLKVPVREDE